MIDSRYRALARVVRIVDEGLEVVLPAWAGHNSEKVVIPFAVLPTELVDVIHRQPDVDECTVYMHAHVNLNAEEATDLVFSGPWELTKNRITNARQINDQGQIVDYGIERLETHNWE